MLAMIAEHQGDLRVKIVAPLPPEQFHEAMVFARDPNGDSANGVGKMEFPRGLDCFGQRPERGHDLIARNLKPVEIPFYSRQKQARLAVVMMVGMDDVSASLEDEVR